MFIKQKEKYNIFSLKNPADRWVIIIGSVFFTAYLVFVSILNLYDTLLSRQLNLNLDYWIFILLALATYNLKSISSKTQIKLIQVTVYGTVAGLLIDALTLLFAYIIKLLEWL
ncbi:hypothetical protein [Acinetobacter sp. HY1485]|uniref:hypothetical protein n=1 Tax=Acinetobacter sp. HY1485 TaxID=2970918 RepID=UPI0022B9C6CB|nr:hypothetical protein [Acinetobacter sp. HY1485]